MAFKLVEIDIPSVSLEGKTLKNAELKFCYSNKEPTYGTDLMQVCTWECESSERALALALALESGVFS